MASSIFGSAYGFSYDGSTFAVTGAVSATGNIRATGGTVNLGTSATGIYEISSNLTLKPADTGGYFVVQNSANGVSVNSAPLLLQNGGTTRARITTPGADTINLTNAAGSGAPTLQVGGVAGVATFGAADATSFTVAAGVLTAIS